MLSGYHELDGWMPLNQNQSNYSGQSQRTQSSEPIKTQANTCSPRKARENAHEQVKIGFGQDFSLVGIVARDF